MAGRIETGKEIGRVTVDGHEVVLVTKGGSDYPGWFITECLTCGKRLRHARQCSGVYAPAYLEPDAKHHATGGK